MYQTPRLCIDGRGARDFAARGLVAQEAIDQLVTAQGEEEVGSPWVEKHRTVLLAHADQVFTGQLKRFNTPLKTRRTPLHSAWEKRFVSSSGIAAFHRFRPIDRLGPTHLCPTITTVLSPKKKLPLFVSRKRNQFYVVASQSDKEILEAQYQVSPEKINIVLPTVRRYVHFSAKPDRTDAETILVLLNNKKELTTRAPFLSVLSKLFPSKPVHVLTLRALNELSPGGWVKCLESAALCFYLMDKPFDWPVPALEAFFWDVPVIFSEKNHALMELLPKSPLMLSKFLVDPMTIEAVQKKMNTQRMKLFQSGCFDAFGVARQYRAVYEKLGPTSAPEELMS